jgi:hypothetical protein
MVSRNDTKRNKGRRADFESYAASVFAPHLFNSSEQICSGCGATALALLTGVPPTTIRGRHRGRHFSDSFMTGFLRQRGYRVLRLTPLSVCGARNVIGHNHVILLSQLFRRYEATWGVIHAQTYYHNFQIFELSALAFLNKPILSAYLVTCPAWSLSGNMVTAKERPLHFSGPRLKISALRQGAAFCHIRTWA